MIFTVAHPRITAHRDFAFHILEIFCTLTIIARFLKCVWLEVNRNKSHSLTSLIKSFKVTHYFHLLPGRHIVKFLTPAAFPHKPYRTLTGNLK